MDCISGLISEIGTSAGNDIGVASDINTTLYTFTIPPYFNKSITFSTPISIALASTSSGTYTLSLNSISGTVNKNGSYFTSPAVSTPTLNPLVLSKSVVVANGVNPSAWTSNQFYTNAIITFTPTYENIVNTYTIVMNANISLPLSTTQTIYFNTTTSTKLKGDDIKINIDDINNYVKKIIKNILISSDKIDKPDYYIPTDNNVKYNIKQIPTESKKCTVCPAMANTPWSNYLSGDDNLKK